MKAKSKTLNALTSEEVRKQILETKKSEPLNYSKIQRLQLLLDKLMDQ
jgi:hypothetical protein